MILLVLFGILYGVLSVNHKELTAEKDSLASHLAQAYIIGNETISNNNIETTANFEKYEAAMFI